MIRVDACGSVSNKDPVWVKPDRVTLPAILSRQLKRPDWKARVDECGSILSNVVANSQAGRQRQGEIGRARQNGFTCGMLKERIQSLSMKDKM
jgi:hypothetical protein